jgi:hypothetical protein
MMALKHETVLQRSKPNSRERFALNGEKPYHIASCANNSIPVMAITCVLK